MRLKILSVGCRVCSRLDELMHSRFITHGCHLNKRTIAKKIQIEMYMPVYSNVVISNIFYHHSNEVDQIPRLFDRRSVEFHLTKKGNNYDKTLMNVSEWHINVRCGCTSN